MQNVLWENKTLLSASNSYRSLPISFKHYQNIHFITIQILARHFMSHIVIWNMAPWWFSILKEKGIEYCVILRNFNEREARRVPCFSYTRKINCNNNYFKVNSLLEVVKGLGMEFWGLTMYSPCVYDDMI